MSKGINIKMPFYHLNNKSVEVEITSENINISNKVKELNTLLNQNKDE
jgi:hypothetical protein